MSREKSAPASDMMPTLSQILEDFSTTGPAGKSIKDGGKPVTIWLPADAKERYDRLMEASRGRKKKFSGVARDALIALIAMAEQKVG